MNHHQRSVSVRQAEDGVPKALRELASVASGAETLHFDADGPQSVIHDNIQAVIAAEGTNVCTGFLTVERLPVNR
jgi:hypothetical protein